MTFARASPNKVSTEDDKLVRLDQGWTTLLASQATLETSKVLLAGMGPCELILRLFLW